MPLIQLMLFVSNDDEEEDSDDEDKAVILLLEFEMNCKGKTRQRRQQLCSSVDPAAACLLASLLHPAGLMIIL